MPRIPSANPDSALLPVPSLSPNYSHGLASRQSFIPFSFQITSPFSNRRVLLPHALVMHVNPQNFSIQHTKKVERIQTRGGWVEQHWGDELDEISADGSTGAFMNIYTGLTSLLRQQTIAWDRYRDLLDLFRNNGSLYDPFGAVVLQGSVMLMFDRGTYNGFFRSFDVEETDEQPFAFKVSWTFKVTEELMKIPGLIQDPSQRGAFTAGPAPAFQGQNAQQSQNTIQGSKPASLSDIQGSALTQRASALGATLGNAQQGTPASTQIEGLVDQAQKAQQRGDYPTAFQRIQSAQDIANTIPPATPPPSAVSASTRTKK